MPGDDHRQGLHDGQLRDPLVLESGPGGVAEPEPAHQDRERRAVRSPEADPRQLLLASGELARHEEVVAELDLVDVAFGDLVEAPAEADDAPRGVAEVELLNPHPRRLVAIHCGYFFHKVALPRVFPTRGVRPSVE